MEKVKEFFSGIFLAFEFVFVLLLLIICYPLYKKLLKEFCKAIFEHD